MKNIEKYQKLIAKGEVDALLLTSKHNRQYAAEYCIAEGVAVICKTQSYYFTDFRYIESAQKNLPGFAVKMVDTEHPYTKLINEAISDNTVKTIGFEDDTLTVEEYTLYNTKLNAVLHPYAAEINAPRASKEPWEIEYMKKAQEITDRTFDDLLNVIHPGMTEKELCAELIYRLYKYGSEGPSFDPITVSGPNTSLPHGVPSERELQYGDFVTMDFGCKFGGYCSDMTRTVVLGRATPEMKRIYDTVLTAQEKAIAAVRGNRPGVPTKPDPTGLYALMTELGADPAATLFVGDSDVDILTGHNAQLPAMGALWGFRGRAELTAAGADALAEVPEDILRYVQERNK